MTDAIIYELVKSLQRHIDSLWGGDVYDLSGTQTQISHCPDELRPLLGFRDTDDEFRIFGPSEVAEGRIQEDIMNLSGKTKVPSAYVEIYPNDPDAVEDWRSSIYSSFDSAQKLDNQELIMVGGASRFHRRMVVKMTCFFLDTGLGSDEVLRLGSAASGFLESICKSKSESGKSWGWMMDDIEGSKIVDPFGERPWRAYPVIAHSRRRGGPPADYIWDIKIYVEVATFQE